MDVDTVSTSPQYNQGSWSKAVVVGRLYCLALANRILSPSPACFFSCNVGEAYTKHQTAPPLIIALKLPYPL